MREKLQSSLSRATGQVWCQQREIDFSREPLGSPPKSSRHLKNKEKGCLTCCNNQLHLFYFVAHTRGFNQNLEFQSPTRTLDLQGHSTQLNQSCVIRGPAKTLVFAPLVRHVQPELRNQSSTRTSIFTSRLQSKRKCPKPMSSCPLRCSAFFAHHLQTVSWEEESGMTVPIQS